VGTLYSYWDVDSLRDVVRTDVVGRMFVFYLFTEMYMHLKLRSCPIAAKTVYEALFPGDSEMRDFDSIPYALDVAMQTPRSRPNRAESLGALHSHWDVN
jgi:hypothetical protein